MSIATKRADSGPAGFAGRNRVSEEVWKSRVRSGWRTGLSTWIGEAIAEDPSTFTRPDPRMCNPELYRKRKEIERLFRSSKVSAAYSHGSKS